jgi:LacI family transcriptional regulator
LQGSEKLTAIFAYNDLVALGAFRAIREANLQVPSDISLVGYDDITVAEFFEVPLTTVQQPMQEIGRKAAELLFEKIRAGSEHQIQHIILKPRLTVRSSTSICPE